LRYDERQTVRQVLAGLPPRQAGLLLLRHAGLTYRELAEVLDVVPGSVGTLLARATAAFEQAYRAEAVGLEQGEEWLDG
ncbi:MAG: sigma factor-like helix-turn-helix DNA-binding protein, partial [Anaerolineae bacterium]